MSLLLKMNKSVFAANVMSVPLQTVKEIKHKLSIERPDLLRDLKTCDMAKLETTQHMIRHLVDLKKTMNVMFALFIVLVTECEETAQWEDIVLEKKEEMRLLDDDRTCACGKNDCFYMGIYKGDTGNLLLGSTCVEKTGIATSAELARQQRDLVLERTPEGLIELADKATKLALKKEERLERAVLKAEKALAKNPTLETRLNYKTAVIAMSKEAMDRQRQLYILHNIENKPSKR